MRKERTCIVCLLVVLLSWSSVYAGGEKGDMGIGLRGGLNRLKGDFVDPAFSPFVYGHIRYNLNDFFALGAEGGYSVVKDNDVPDFQTYLFPYEVHATLSFLPLSRVNPYAILGGGGVYWNATFDGETVRFPPNIGELQKGVDSFFKAGAGLEIALTKSNDFYMSLGATYRYSLTDMLDQNYEGDLNDGLIDFYAGLSYFFRTSSNGDKDGDGIPDELDLAPEQAEDMDGYFDHDGKKEGVPYLTGAQGKVDVKDISDDDTAPVVIHNPLRRVEAGRDIKISAEIYENYMLKVAAVLHRPKGFKEWNMAKIKSTNELDYTGTIPGDMVRAQGLEYCVIAVDEAISGVGYCGLPNRPVDVKVISNPLMWRVFNTTAALIGWGAAGYMYTKKQN